jgi:photosystem II stability/assembly factor-like uncharacterized protein
MKRVTFLLLVLTFLTIRVSAQWTKTAPNLLGPLSQSVGAMSYSFGVVWAGTYSLWSSTDEGTTWVQNSLKVTGDLAQISFIDHNDGLVTSHAGYVYKTSDGGVTWTTVLTIGSATSACFLDNTNNILVSEFQPGTVHYSRDGGTTWNSTYNNNWIREILPSVNGKAYLLSGDWGPQEHIWVSTDYGASWTEQAGEVNADSYSFDFNGCNNNNMIIANEGYSNTEDYDGRSRLDVSMDGGQTWTAPENYASKYFAGSVTEGPNTIFSQTVSEVSLGLVRSTDNGQTWKNISGPSSTGDTRLIAAIDDNNIVGADIDGSIWVTHNSGGDSLSLSSSGTGPTTLTLSPTTESVHDTLCVSKDTSYKLGGTGCLGVTLENVSITGSPAFHIVDLRGIPRVLDSLDSVNIVFTPTPPGADTSYLHLQYNLGSGSRDTVITLIGFSKNTSNTLFLAPTTESVLDTVCNVKDTSFRLGGTGCPGVTLVNAFMTGSSAFSIADLRKTPRSLDSLDSVRIVYAPTPPGLDTTYLHLVYNTGSGDRDTIVTLIGTLSSSVRSVTLETAPSPQIVQATCVPLSIPISLWVTGCLISGGRLDSAWLVGSPAIHISDTRGVPRGLGSFDSVQLQYLPGATAPDTAVLHLRYDLGSGTVDTTITVIGTVMNPLPPPAILLPASVESILSKSCGGSDTGLRIGVTGCPLQNGMLDSVWLTGSPTLQISDTRSVPRSLLISDSIGILYSPNGGGSDTSELHIRYDVGAGPQDTVLTVIGSVASPLLAQPAHMRRESASAYYDGLDSLPLQLDISTSVNFDSLWNLVTDIQGTCAFDQNVVGAVQYLPPTPWTLVSFMAHANSFDFEIHNSTGRAQNPLDLGTALFRPKSSEPATSWVTMPQLLLTIGNQTNSLCVIDNEDNHWAVKTLGLTAAVQNSRSQVQDISVYPNPAGDELFVKNDDALPASIAIYDVIGREVTTENVLAGSTGSINIAGLARGSYVLVCHIGDRVTTFRVNKVQ